LSRFVHIDSQAYYSLSACEGRMRRKTRSETPIERIFRKVMGYKMPLSVRRVLLPKQKDTRRR